MLYTLQFTILHTVSARTILDDACTLEMRRVTSSDFVENSEKGENKHVPVVGRLEHGLREFIPRDIYPKLRRSWEQ